MALKIIQGDLTAVSADAVVNAANSRLQAGGGVCGAIFSAAGRRELQAACDRIGYCAEGDAVLTDGFRLARYVIHTVGPVWHGGTSGEEQRLRSCYKSALRLALAHGCRSVAFPLISAGIFGYPEEQALPVAVSAIESEPETAEMQVYLVLYKDETYDLGRRLFPALCG